ncbi:MAG TPA: hypothetical protein VFR78_21050 [Pyrinomonadaceae bacterium]|nr:hypothetical protein [Pyrinomonadaceae bacterium]
MRITYLIEVALLLYASQFIVAPILIYFSNKQPADPQFTPFDLLNPPLRLPTSYMQSLPVLESLGFQPVAHLFSATLATNVRVVLTLYVNRQERETATVVHTLAEVPPVTRIQVTCTEFSTKFDDGHEVNTLNSDQPALFVQVPEKQIFRLPNLTNVQHLYEVHRALTAQRLGANKRLPLPGHEVAELIDGMKRILATEAAFGRIALDATGEWYRPTMRGAIRDTLMLIWPVGMVRRKLQRRRGVRLAADILGNR